MALAELHRVTAVDSTIELVFDADLDADWVGDVLVGAGFGVRRLEPTAQGLATTSQREMSLPDTVGPDMRVLVCGLNPSVHAAEMGVGFGRAGNRFWPAALAAGLVSVDRDPRHALSAHGVGMTDLVKRATPRADELHRSEYEAGLTRLDRLCAWLQPRVVCMVGLAGWRAAADRTATVGLQPATLGGCPVYVMPSTSGLNAHSRLEDLTDHLREVRGLAERSVSAGPDP